MESINRYYLTIQWSGYEQSSEEEQWHGKDEDQKRGAPTCMSEGRAE